MTYTRANIPVGIIKHRPAHPGRMLAEEIEFRGLNANALAAKLHVPRNRLAAIINGERSITPDTALRLERCLGIKAYLWIGLQAKHDLAMAEQEYGDRIRKEIKPEPFAAGATAP